MLLVQRFEYAGLHLQFIEGLEGHQTPPGLLLPQLIE
jgi:hypothetical protein